MPSETDVALKMEEIMRKLRIARDPVRAMEGGGKKLWKQWSG